MLLLEKNRKTEKNEKPGGNGKKRRKIGILLKSNESRFGIYTRKTKESLFEI
jgi:hypothetical protein